MEGAFYDFSKGGSFETVVKSTAPAAPAKRGRKPAAKKEGAAPAAPAKRGRKPAAKEEGAVPAVPAKRGRKPAAKEAEQTEQ